MLATLDIEHNNDSDEDFVADEEEESHSSDGSEAEEREASTKQPGKMSRKYCITVKQSKGRWDLRLGHQKSLQSTHDSLPPPVKKRKLMNLASTSDGDSEYQPCKRKSKHLEEIDSMLEGTDEIENIVPPFNRTSSLESWTSFEEHFAMYKKKYNLKCPELRKNCAL
ncbi:hypothetical protein PPTG_03444 [Phytophthora nicotianae INRA-310]|uniref:Uncharacterized protein n=1 Tax=Phytophthora nicotianae (strain INRA-310) TaxID=761204 RepID=W2R7E1_PHYN3|nr:hypothetical protein PPTG_03444 [Phytophthora nicotianae INRA-310]ETN20435.1 hypothetical protein PPTG_03444 [Phytophthora nicotianae INRA-310]